MTVTDYPVDLRAQYPERSSRGWAVCTIIIFIKLLALLPHIVVLIFLAIAQFVVAIVGQVVVAVRGEYPEGMFEFNAGVLRWLTRVGAFLYSLTDRYPPFSLRSDPEYPIDIVLQRPPRSSRLYALFTLLVEIAAVVGGVFFIIYLVHHSSAASSSGASSRFNPAGDGGSGLLLRDLAALPHLIILGILGIATFVIWIIVQWVILVVARYPRGMWDFVVGVTRWQVRVNAYTLGLVDRYPPFTFDPSIAAPDLAPPTAGGPGFPPAPPSPPPPGALGGYRPAPGPASYPAPQPAPPPQEQPSGVQPWQPQLGADAPPPDALPPDAPPPDAQPGPAIPPAPPAPPAPPVPPV